MPILVVALMGVAADVTRVCVDELRLAGKQKLDPFVVMMGEAYGTSSTKHQDVYPLSCRPMAGRLTEPDLGVPADGWARGFHMGENVVRLDGYYSHQVLCSKFTVPISTAEMPTLCNNWLFDCHVDECRSKYQRVGRRQLAEGHTSTIAPSHSQPNLRQLQQLDHEHVAHKHIPHNHIPHRPSQPATDPVVEPHQASHHHMRHLSHHSSSSSHHHTPTYTNDCFGPPGFGRGDNYEFGNCHSRTHYDTLFSQPLWCCDFNASKLTVGVRVKVYDDDQTFTGMWDDLMASWVIGSDILVAKNRTVEYANEAVQVKAWVSTASSFPEYPPAPFSGTTSLLLTSLANVMESPSGTFGTLLAPLLVGCAITMLVLIRAVPRRPQLL